MPGERREMFARTLAGIHWGLHGPQPAAGELEERRLPVPAVHRSSDCAGDTGASGRSQMLLLNGIRRDPCRTPSCPASSRHRRWDGDRSGQPNPLRGTDAETLPLAAEDVRAAPCNSQLPLKSMTDGRRCRRGQTAAARGVQHDRWGTPCGAASPIATAAQSWA